MKIIRLSFVVLSCALAAHLTGCSKNNPRTDTDRAASIHGTQQMYYALHQNHDVWLTDAIPQERFYMQAADVAWKRGEHARELLKANREALPETGKIWNHFQNFAASLLIGEEVPGRVRSVANPTDRDKIGLREHKEMIFIPRQMAVKYIQSGYGGMMMAWRNDAGLMVADIQWSDKQLVGLLYHQLYFGVLYPYGPQTKLPDPHSLEHAGRQMEAHRIQSAVLNKVTGGAYFKRFDEIIKRVGPSSDVKDIVSQMDINDLRAFDDMLGMKTAGIIAARLAISQHLLGLGAYVLEPRRRPKKEIAEFFLWASNAGNEIMSR